MFNGAKVIFATHGGGSFNVVWAPRDSFMVEVIPEDIKMLSVQTAAAAVGTGWIGMIPKGSSFSETFTLDTDAVVHNIALALDAYNHAY
jgi:capsular polysaccharide biosynthesis protein